MGKLVNVAIETFEKEKLILKSQQDGLTGLYNATTTEELIRKRNTTMEKETLDAFILMDSDNLKQINDS